MLERIAYLRAERASIARLIEESREVVPPEIDEDGTTIDPVATLTQRIASLDRDIAAWEAAATRIL